MYIYIYIYIHVYMHLHTYIHTYIYIHTHILTWAFDQYRSYVFALTQYHTISYFFVNGCVTCLLIKACGMHTYTVGNAHTYIPCTLWYACNYVDTSSESHTVASVTVSPTRTLTGVSDSPKPLPSMTKVAPPDCISRVYMYK